MKIGRRRFMLFIIAAWTVVMLTTGNTFTLRAFAFIQSTEMTVSDSVLVEVETESLTVKLFSMAMSQPVMSAARTQNPKIIMDLYLGAMALAFFGLFLIWRDPKFRWSSTSKKKSDFSKRNKKDSKGPESSSKENGLQG